MAIQQPIGRPCPECGDTCIIMHCGNAHLELINTPPNLLFSENAPLRALACTQCGFVTLWTDPQQLQQTINRVSQKLAQSS